MPTHSQLVISPETKLDALLAHDPALLALILRLAPAFARLQNPALRDAVARNTTLRQVAESGDHPLSEVIREVQQASGLTANVLAQDGERPAWAQAERVAARYDARADIDGGKHPLEAVMMGLTQLKAGEVYELVTPFVPGPLLDIARGQGYDHFTDSSAAAEFHTYFHRAGA